MKPSFLIFLISLLLAALPGCSEEPPANDDDATDDDDSAGDDDDVPPPVTLIFEGGWSFGHCAGLCWASAALSSDGSLDYTMGSWTKTDSWDLSTAMTETGFAELSGLLDAVDVPALDPVYGCPDCADGGAKDATWHAESGSTTTSYEFSFPPLVLLDLDTAMMAITTEATTCGFLYWLTDPGDCVPVPES